MLDTEPVLTTASVVAAVSALLTVVVALGLPLTPAQTEAILALLVVAAPVASAVWGRIYAYSPATVRNLKAQES